MTVGLYEHVGMTTEKPHTHELVAAYRDGEGWLKGGERFGHVDEYPRETDEGFLMRIFDDARLYAAQFDKGAEPPSTRGGDQQDASTAPTNESDEAAEETP